MSNLIKQGRRAASALKKAGDNDPAAPPPDVAQNAARGHEPSFDSHVGAQVVQRLASALPTPYEVPESVDRLGEEEQRDLETCETALDHLRLAFWVAGRALEVIQKARLYRETHDTFETYCLERWGLSKPHAYRLINEWRLAERLVVSSPFGDKINESHVRQLLPLAADHGDELAELVFTTVAEADGVKLTAEVLKGAVAALPPGEFDRSTAVAEIQRFLAGQAPTSTEERTATSLKGFERQASKARQDLERLAERVTGRRAVDRDGVQRFVADMRALLDQIEKAADPTR